MGDNERSLQSATRYQSTGRTSPSPTNGYGINGYTRNTNLTKPSVFDFNIKSNVCPTCQGTGRVPKTHDDELVAIIPYKDKRLKRPKRYCCYFSMCLLLLIVVGVVSAFLLFPRPVTIQQFKYSSGTWDIKNTTTNTSIFSEVDFLFKVTMELKVHIHMQNPNFVAVTVNSLNVSVMHDLTMAGTTMKTGLTLPLLSDATNIVDVPCTFEGKEAIRVQMLCSLLPHEQSILYFSFQVSSTYTFIAQTFQTDYSTLVGIPCHIKNSTVSST